MVAADEILVADECWVALALLHRAHAQRESFSAREILDRLKLEKAHSEVRAGVPAHIYQHNVANAEPSSARYRMFYKLGDGAYRLFRPGDDFHAARKGKTTPQRSGLPGSYHYLLDWYEKEYCSSAELADEERDPVLQMWGIGKELWADVGGGDAFVAREREEWDSKDREAPPIGALTDRVWDRIKDHQDEQFHTATGLAFTHRVQGESGIWFYRAGRRINQRLSRSQVDEAVSRCPLQKTTVINDLRDYAYLFGLLMDRRIRGSDW
jgi:hypothetical protein